jgi:hypothetical protein
MNREERADAPRVVVREEASIHKIQIDARLAQRLADPELVDPKHANRLMRIGFRIDEWRREPNLTKKRHQWLDHAFTLWLEALELLASGETAAALDRALEAVEWSTAKESSDTLAAVLRRAKHAHGQQRWATEDQEKIVLDLADLKKKWGTDKKAKQVLTDKIARRGEGKSRRAASKQIERAIDAVQKYPVLRKRDG